MKNPYNTTSISGFVHADSIQAGLMSDNRTPVVRIQVVSGDQPHPVFILNRSLAVEFYAWYLCMSQCHTKKVYIASAASIYSNGTAMVLVANDVDFNTSNEKLRVEVGRCSQKMRTGRSDHQWPTDIIEFPLKAPSKEGAGE
jgi:hypothetical protein